MAEQEKKQTGKKRNYKQKHQFYEVKGDTVERKNKSCPKCGPAVFLAVHSNRVSCGGCGYTEKTEAPKAEISAEEKKVEGGAVEGSRKEEPKKEVLAEEKKEEAPAEKKD